jgi:integrase
MFNKLMQFNEWNGPNPLQHVKKVRQFNKELRYLELDEIQRLLTALEGGRSTLPALVGQISLATGMRWNEANELRRENLVPSQNKITITKTKNTQARTVLIKPELMEKILNQGESYGRLFPVDYYKSFMNAIERANIKLPAGQGARVTRHTFASWYMINGGRIEVLQKILGHGTITMTMRYAHLAPDFLDTMTTLNPIDYIKPK